jgi:hypothetical protein
MLRTFTIKSVKIPYKSQKDCLFVALEGAGDLSLAINMGFAHFNA